MPARIKIIMRGCSISLLLAALAGISVRAAGPALSSPVVAAARGLIQRVVPKQAKLFDAEVIPPAGGHDVFEVASQNGKIILRGNNSVSIASALNWYLQNKCHCDISWHCGNQLKLPKRLPSVHGTTRIVSPYKYRYAYNFCTYGYTMAWWHWPQWQRELDFLAMNGVNLALVIEGQESVWIDTFTNFGYSPAQICGWVVDPAHLPWFEMDNMESYGGPLWPQLVAQRLKLGQKIIVRMHQLGIKPVLPGYYGMVPPDFNKRFPNADVRSQGNWNHLKRPDILDPTDRMFAKVATAYYAAERCLFGSTRFYDADPFHEGGSTTGVDLPAAGHAILKAMNGATWVLQSLGPNPRQEMIDALDKNKLLILDLRCEVHENWRLRNNFNGTPWLWCAINCYGGNMSVGGRLRWMAAGPDNALINPGRGRMSGIGATMEGTGVNPVYWEMLFEDAWRTNVPNLKIWVDNYVWRRYGAKIPAAEKAWRTLVAIVYNKIVPFWIAKPAVCSRPSLNAFDTPRYYSAYTMTRMMEAWKLLLEAAPEANSSPGYRFDLCDVGRQVLADLGTHYDQQIIAAYKARDAVALRKLSEKMLGLIRDMNTLAGTQRQWLLGIWLAEARSWGATPAEKDLCERDARELLTTWTRYDNITDYANRQWNGLLGEFYYHRWAMWLKALNNSVASGKPINETAVRGKIRKWELWWTRQTSGHFATNPHGNTVAISRKLFRKYAADASHNSVPEKELHNN